MPGSPCPRLTRCLRYPNPPKPDATQSYPCLPKALCAELHLPPVPRQKRTPARPRQATVAPSQRAHVRQQPPSHPIRSTWPARRILSCCACERRCPEPDLALCPAANQFPCRRTIRRPKRTRQQARLLLRQRHRRSRPRGRPRPCPMECWSRLLSRQQRRKQPRCRSPRRAQPRLSRNLRQRSAPAPIRLLAVV